MGMNSGEKELQIKMEGKYGDLRRQSEWKGKQGQMERLREEEKGGVVKGEDGKQCITVWFIFKYFKILRKKKDELKTPGCK